MRAARLAFAVVALALSACAATSHRGIDGKTIDVEARRLMQREHVNGFAFAVIDDGAVAYVNAYGIRKSNPDAPLTIDTIMYGASLTKTVFAYTVMQLVDQHRLDLDASIATLLPTPLPEYERWSDLAGDQRWRLLTPRILLAHASGFANFRWLEPDEHLRFHNHPGTRYGYSGEGLQLLQFVLEKGQLIDVGREIQTHVFDRFAMTRTSMQWRPDFAGNLVEGYRLDGSVEQHRARSRVDVAGSMDTTIADQARLWAGIVRGEGLGVDARAQMVKPQMPIVSLHQFPTLMPETTTDNTRISLAGGIGVVTFEGIEGRAWFKGGHDDATGNMAVCVEQCKRCVVLLSNDVRAERLYPELVTIVLGETSLPWNWEYTWFTKTK